MKAIVLTYDKYHGIADHMINTYMLIWPDNPFTFRVPYQKYPTFLKKKYQNKVEFIKTDKRIKQTLMSLIEDLSDDEWIYWCMDDRYPISLNIYDVLSIYNWILNTAPSDLSGIMFSNFQKMMHVKNIMSDNNCIFDNRGRKYYRRRNYAMIWMHQFIRVKVIRTLFGEFPEDINQAKQMDYFKKNLLLPEEQKLYVYSKCTAVYGESTHRGKMTLNCANSFKKFGMDLPTDFEVLNKQILIQKNNSQLAYIKYKIEQLAFCLLSQMGLFSDKIDRNKKSIQYPSA